LADITNAFASPGNLFTGTLRTIVFDNAAPGLQLDFLYQVRNTTVQGNNPPEFIDRISIFGFSSITLPSLPNVDFVQVGSPTFNGGTTPSISADRSLDGNRISFDFQLLPGLFNGETSRWLYVQTNATSFGASTANIIGAGVASVGTLAPAPAATVPEPLSPFFGALVLMCTVAAGSFFGRTRQ